MEFKLHIPIFLQIIESIKSDIIHGHLIPGDQLPSVREYADTLRVNPNTVQKAFQEMENDGLCESRRGLGRYIIDEQDLAARLKKEKLQQLTSDYLQDMLALDLELNEILNHITTHYKEAL
jgi:GntR family transcriptional regulator